MTDYISKINISDIVYDIKDGSLDETLAEKIDNVINNTLYPIIEEV